MSQPTEQVRYECVRCGNCCRWRGIVRVSEVEVERIADFLGMSPYQVAEKYTVLAGDRRTLILTERQDEACIFLSDDNLCRIHPVKPQQCKDFPDKWQVPDLERCCHARRHSSESGLADGA